MTNRPKPLSKFSVAFIMLWISSALAGIAVAPAIFGDPARMPRTVIYIAAVIALVATLYFLSELPRQEFGALMALYAGVVMNLIALAVLIIAP